MSKEHVGEMIGHHATENQAVMKKDEQPSIDAAKIY